MQLKNYRNQIDKTVNILRQIETVANEMNMKSAVKQVKSIMRRMEGETFHLVIVGEFSRGKSTFVNALLGKKILPASKQPTTAIISKIVYGDTPSYKLYFKQGKSPQKLDEANFIKITAPKQPDEDDEVSIQEYKNAQKLISEIVSLKFFPLVKTSQNFLFFRCLKAFNFFSFFIKLFNFYKIFIIIFYYGNEKK